MSFTRAIYGRALCGEGRGNFDGGWIARQNDRVFPKEATYPAFLMQQAIETLENHRDAKQPFYLQLDFFGPHQPFAIPGDLGDREREIRESVHLPDSYKRFLENGFRAPWIEPRVYRMYRKNWGMSHPESMIDYMVANQLQFELFLWREYRLKSGSTDSAFWIQCRAPLARKTKRSSLISGAM